MTEIHWGLTRIQTSQSHHNMRSMPSPTAGIVAQVPNGSYITITRGTDTVENGGLTWFAMSYNKDVGWMANTEALRLYRIPYHDMFSYIGVAGMFAPVYVLNSNFVSPGEKTQLQYAALPDGQKSSTFYIAKGHNSPANWEQFRISNEYIYRVADISPFEQGQMYVIGDDVGGGAPWIKRFMLEGETFTFQTRLGWRYKDTGSAVEQHPPWIAWTQYIKLVKIYEDWISPQGIKLPFVAEFLVSDFQNKPQESMWFARGLVQWKSYTEHNSQGQLFHSWVQQVIPTTDQHLARRPIPWWDNRQKLTTFPELEQPVPVPVPIPTPRIVTVTVTRGENTYSGQLTEVLK
jgi:hypothetical protein